MLGTPSTARGAGSAGTVRGEDLSSIGWQQTAAAAREADNPLALG